MLEAAEGMEFERAALLRDKIAELKGEKVASPQAKKARGGRRGSGKKPGEAKTSGAPSPYPKRPPRPKANGG